MLKRLLIAVLVLGLIAAFCGTAFSENPKDDSRVTLQSKGINLPPTNVPAKAKVFPGNLALPASHRPIATPMPVTDNSGSLGPASIDTTGCGILDYTVAGLYYQVAFAGDWGEGYAMSFDVPNGHRAEVSKIGLRCYGKIGNPILTFNICEDNAGVPGTVIGSYSPTLTVGNVLYTLPSIITVPAGNATYWVTAIITGTPADTAKLGITTNGGSPTGRGRYWASPNWYLMPAVFPSLGDVDARLAVQQCFYYSQCYSYVIDPRGMYSLSIPDPAWPGGVILDGFGQRFTAEGPETLQGVKVMTVDLTGSGGRPPHYLYGPTSTNGLIVSVWADSSGSIDKSTGPIHTATLAGGLANLYPVTNNDGSALPIRRDTAYVPFPAGTVLAPGPYHITVQMSSPNEADGAPYFRYGVDATYGGGSVNFIGGGQWELASQNATFIAEGLGWGGSWDIRPQLCKDEFSLCSSTSLYDFSAMYTWYLYGGTRKALAQKVRGLQINRVEKLRFQVMSDAGTVGLTASIWGSTPTGPGALLYSQAVPAPTFYPGWTEVVIPGGVQVLGDFYIGYSAIGPFAADTLYGLSEDDAAPHAHTCRNGGVWDLRDNGVDPAYWRSLATTFGYTDNLMAEVDFCSIKPTERICGAEDNWPTLAHDFQRTSASSQEIGDAYCDLTLNWRSFRPTGYSITDNGPIIYDGKVVMNYSGATATTYVISDLATGAILHILDGTSNPDEFGGNARCTPSVYEVGGVPYLFLSSGNPGGISAWDLSGAMAAPVWSLNAANNWMGIADSALGGAMGLTRYGTTVVVNVAGTDVVYWTDDNNYLYAANAATGAAYWVKPYNLGLSAQKSISTDGTNLYLSLFNVAGNGDVVAVACATGVKVWNLAATVGLQAGVIWAGASDEDFLCGPTVDMATGSVWINSVNAVGPSPSGGVLYKVDGASGASQMVIPSMRVRYGHMMLDANTIIVPTRTRWLPHPLGGDLVAFDKNNGAIVWAASSFPQTSSGGALSGLSRYANEGVLTCEPNLPDYAIAFNEMGYLGFFNADNGNEVFNRRIDWIIDGNAGGMGALGRDAAGNVHVVFVDVQGGLFDLMKTNVDRPRLELLVTSPQFVPVPFGSAYDTPITFQNVFTNTGCTDLVVSLTANTTSNGTTPPSPAKGPSFKMIRSEIASSVGSIADRLTQNSNSFVMATELVDNDAPIPSVDSDRQLTNAAAAATPSFLIQNAGSYAGDVFLPANGGWIVNPGDTSDVTVRVDGPAISRGPQCFYVEFTTHNDPDYYLNSSTKRPELQFCLVGGCLTDTTWLHFGAAGANIQLVSNMGRMAMADWTPYGFEINGSADILFAGTFMYGVDSIRLAMNAVPWTSGSTEAQAWVAMQGDPNWCDGSCKPKLQSSVSLGEVTADGLTYATITGSLVCKSYIDSVQNYDDGAGGWDWDLAQPRPFDNALTMGIYAKTRTVGVLSAPPAAALLNNLTLEIMEFNERNGASVPGWYFGAQCDHDMNVVDDPAGTGTDSAALDRVNSVGWSYTRGATNTTVAGLIKVPFGCGYESMLTTVRMSSQQSMFDETVRWDSAYYYMSKTPGFYAQVANFEASDDEQVLYGIARKDFGPNDTTSFGVAFFSLDGVANPTTSAGDIAATAQLVNKWAGFGRGDVNNDNAVNLADIIYLADYINFPGKPGPIPFKHAGDVNASGGLPDLADVTFLVNYYFNHGACPIGDWAF